LRFAATTFGLLLLSCDHAHREYPVASRDRVLALLLGPLAVLVEVAPGLLLALAVS
jgi:hypothetical protein